MAIQDNTNALRSLLNTASTLPSAGSTIDDSTPAADKTYSSQKIESSLNELKEKNDAQDEAIANAGKVKSVNSKTGDVTLSASDVGALSSSGTAADSSKLGGEAASAYKNFKTKNTHAVTINSSFINSGGVVANSIAGIVKIGGYVKLKSGYAGNNTTQVIATVSGIQVSGNTYATVVDRATGKAFDVILYADTSAGTSIVQLESSANKMDAGTWLNFTIMGVLE